MTDLIKMFLASATLAAGLGASAAQAEFRGGGVIHNVTHECTTYGLASEAQPVRATFRPIEVFGGASHLSLFLPSGGAINFRGAGSFSPTEPVRRVRGTGIFGEMFVVGSARPRLRATARNTISPWRADFAEADELSMRFVIRNFDGVPGCNVNVSLSLRKSL